MGLRAGRARARRPRRLLDLRHDRGTVHLLATPETAVAYLPLIEAALARAGVRLEGGAARVAIAFVAVRTRIFTYPTVSHYLGGAGVVKVNLHPGDWRDPADRARFLDDLAPEIYTGDPVAFLERARLPLATRPKALVSSATAVLPGFRARLEARFGCPPRPLLDDRDRPDRGPRGGRPLRDPPARHLRRGDRPAGRPCAPGERGEVAVTVARNPLCPLLRYRTGDFAAIDVAPDGAPVLVDLEGRAPAIFRTTAGRLFSAVDATTALERFPLPFLSLRQARDGALTLRVPRGAAPAAELGGSSAPMPGSTSARSTSARPGPGSRFSTKVKSSRID